MPVVGPEPLLGADRKSNKRLVENKINLAVWWAGISSWLHGAACLGWEEGTEVGCSVTADPKMLHPSLAGLLEEDAAA